MVSPAHYIALAVILFVIGAVGVLVRRNAIVIFMCVELMLNAANLAFGGFSRLHGTLVVVGLAIITSIYRTRRSASVDDANLLKY